MPTSLDLDAALRRFDVAAAEAVVSGRRLLLGLTGAPGAGKSTLAERLVDRARAAHGPAAAVVVPMDGFHLANALLIDRGSRDRKGAPDTFDDAGFAALLVRVREQGDLEAGRGDGRTVYAPRFDREHDESIGSAVSVPTACPVVVVEGNYLLVADGAWPDAARCLDEVWHLTLPETQRHERLIARHVAHGMDHDAARAWALGPDEANAVLIEAAGTRADVVVAVD
ncbi:nucleoside/nucleotide kinase family protein [Tersicoccus sp. MR15.9]|uniref:nucleoside/nucleotide kinase family protein n=1 Tax=Tersicoccus mangrovi TaxID=3121635 RepID=UPI002FE50548